MYGVVLAWDEPQLVADNIVSLSAIVITRMGATVTIHVKQLF